MTRINALLALVLRDLRIASRRIDLLIQTMAVPVVVLGLASIIFGASDAWPIAVIDKANTPESQAVVHAIDDSRGATGPYFETITTDANTATALLQEGRLHLVVTIPADFETSHTIQTQTYNINTDAMKNVRLRLDVAANLHDQPHGLNAVTAELDKAKPHDVTRTAFMGGSAVILALLLGAALISANLYAVDAEHRTRKELALTPLGISQAGLGAAIAGTILAIPAALPTLALALAFGTRTTFDNLLQASLIVLPAMLAAAGLGVLAATALKTHRAIQPTLILLALGSYFASGGFIPVPSLPPLARTIATWWPPSYIFEWTNPVLHGFQGNPTGTAIAITVTAATATLVWAMVATYQDHLKAHVQGQ